MTTRIRSLPPTRTEASHLLALCLPALDAVTPHLLRRVDHALDGTPAASLRDDTQIVLAEAINNVVEHAYTGSGFGAVAVSVSVLATALEITLTDWGRPVPDLALCEGRPDPTLLSEGGYGWFLIRSLTSEAQHVRVGAENRLLMRIDLPMA